MTTTVRIGWVLAGFVLAGTTVGAQPPRGAKETPAQLKARVEKSLVYLQFWYEADAAEKPGGKDDRKFSNLAGLGTGFVVEGPNKIKWIATASHAFWTADPKKRVASVTYRLPTEAKPFTCSAILLNEKYDAAMLAPSRACPLDAPPLEWAAAVPKLGDELLVVGSPTGLEFDDQAGTARHPPITVQQLARLQFKELGAYAPMAADLVFLRHNIPIADGFSGSPILALADGKVVGVQSSTLKNTDSYGFAVHKQHVMNFDWKTPPRRLTDPILVSPNLSLSLKSAPAVPFKANPVAPPPKVKEPPPVRIKLNGVDVEAPFVHHGYIEGDAKAVVEKYVQDKDWYLTEANGGRRMTHLQSVLDRGPVARISNPLLGLQLLVPRGYIYSAQATEKPNGLLVTFRPDREVRKPYDWPLSIWVTLEPEHFAHARAKFQAGVDQARKDFATGVNKSGRSPVFVPEDFDNPAALAVYRDRWVNASVADVIDPRFAERDLEIRVRIDPKDPKDQPTYRGKVGNPVHTRLIGGEGVWLRSNYFAVKGDLGHYVRITGRDPRAFVVHFPFTQADLTAFTTGKGLPDVTALEYAIIASTVSAR